MKDTARSEPLVAYARDDLELAAMVDVRARVEPEFPPPRLENLRHNLAANPGLAYLVARIDGTPVGCGFANVSQEGPVAQAHVVVVPDRRRRGAGTALLRTASEFARSAGRSLLEGQVRADDRAALAYFGDRGFERIGGEQAVALDLRTLDPVRLQPLEGITIVSRADRPDLLEGMYAVAREAEADIPGSGPVQSFETWRANEIDRPSLEPELTFLALAGSEVVGYAILDSIRGELWHRLTGVKRSWRRRGVATALKRAQIAAARDRGASRLVARMEERNEPMQRLNGALGYRPEPGLSTIVVRGPLLEPCSQTA